MTPCYYISRDLHGRGMDRLAAWPDKELPAFRIGRFMVWDDSAIPLAMAAALRERHHMESWDNVCSYSVRLCGDPLRCLEGTRTLDPDSEVIARAGFYFAAMPGTKIRLSNDAAVAMLSTWKLVIVNGTGHYSGFWQFPSIDAPGSERQECLQPCLAFGD